MTPEQSIRVSKELVLINRYGLHSRPMFQWVGLAEQFESEIVVEIDGSKIDGKNPMEMILLDIPQGKRFRVHAVGSDAHEAAEALAALVARGFGELDR